MPMADALLMELDQEAKTTQRVLERVPEDKLSWKPHQKSFSLGQLALHLAAGPGMIARADLQDNVELPSMSQPEPRSRKEVLDAFAQSVAAAKDALRKMDDARLLATWTASRNGKVLLSMPRVAFVRAILLNHHYHHRGQLSVYLRLLDVPVPSIYGPSADENVFA